MKLESQAFNEQNDIPVMYTCDGDDISPHLFWSEFPVETKSFALTCIDPDAPMGDFNHWFVANIPATTVQLKDGCSCPKGAIEVENDFGKKPYGGPCPPSGKHQYIFKIYALDVAKLDGLTNENFLEEVQIHTLDSAELTGLYQRH